MDYNWDLALHRACFAGDIFSIDYCISKGARDLNSGLQIICKQGYKELIPMMITRGARGWDGAMVSSCSAGHLDLVLFFIEKGANFFNLGLCKANDNGHKNIMYLMLEKGADINLAYFDEFDIDYLLTRNIKKFGIYEPVVQYLKNRRQLIRDIFKELNYRDVDSIIVSY